MELCITVIWLVSNCVSREEVYTFWTVYRIERKTEGFCGVALSV